MIQKQWNYSNSLAVWLWCHTDHWPSDSHHFMVAQQPASSPVQPCSCWHCPQPLNCVWQRKHSPNHNAVPCSGAHQGLLHPFYFSKGCNCLFRGHQRLPVLAPERRPAHRRASKTKSVFWKRNMTLLNIRGVSSFLSHPPQGHHPKAAPPNSPPCLWEKNHLHLLLLHGPAAAHQPPVL